jgi:hypothetical protein
MVRAGLDGPERRQQQHRGGPEQQRLGRPPARVVGVDQGVDQQRQPGGDRYRTGNVEAAGAGLGG